MDSSTITAHLSSKLKEFHTSLFEIQDKELWIFFLSVRIAEKFLSIHFTTRRDSWIAFLLQHFYLFPMEVTEVLVRESLALTAPFNNEQLLEAFLSSAHSDDRYLLIEVIRELLSSRTQVPKEDIDLFMGIVKNRRTLHLISPEQSFKNEQRISVGTSPENDLVLPPDFINEQQCIIYFEEDHFTIRGQGDTVLYIKGEKFQEYEGSISFLEFQIEHTPLYFFFHERVLFYEDSVSHYLSLHQYSVFIAETQRYPRFLFWKEVPKKEIIKDLNVVFRSGEFVGIFGPTGSGKSTFLLSLLNRFETKGELWVDGIAYRPYYQQHYYEIGYVPQDDLLHRELTVEETFRYSLELRGLAKTRQELAHLIQHTVERLGLESTLDILIGDENFKGVSGGQRKRVNLGLELLSSNLYLLMLDEPTSGLDPATELQIHRLLKELAIQGLTVIIVSHSLYETLTFIMDKVVILTNQGELAYFGPAQKVASYFQVENITEVFEVLATKPSAYWKSKFCTINNFHYRKFVLTRQNLNSAKVISDHKKEERYTPRKYRSAADVHVEVGVLKQFWVFSKRLFQRQFRDLQMLSWRFGQWGLLAVLMSFVYTAPENGLLTLLSILPFWMGSAMTVRSINHERALFRRELRYRLKITPYVLSIFFVNAVMTLFQTLLFMIILYQLMYFGPPFNFGFMLLWQTLYLSSLVGIAFGMWISALFNSQQAAVTILPGALVVMILFGGGVFPVNLMKETAYQISNIVAPTRWTLESLVYQGQCMAQVTPIKSPMHSRKCLLAAISPSFQSIFQDYAVEPYEILNNLQAQEIETLKATFEPQTTPKPENLNPDFKELMEGRGLEWKQFISKVTPQDLKIFGQIKKLDVLIDENSPPVWETTWFSQLFSQKPKPRAGAGMEAMGFYRGTVDECLAKYHFDINAPCPQALIHPEQIQFILMLYVITLLGACITALAYIGGKGA
ncbi:ATP-binding cassette domain-containing protein [Deltaproteobacteria bacterium TL4]